MKLQGVKLRRYQKGDEVGIVRLFEEVYGHRRSLTHWFWKFTDNVMKKAPIWLAENERDQLIAHYAVCPVPVKLGETILLGAQSLDTMVAADYQRRRLMVTLAEKCYNDSRDAGINLIYGYPNEKSYHPLVHRLGFHDLGTVSKYELTFSTMTHLPPYPILENIGIVRRLTGRLDEWIYPKYSACDRASTNRIRMYGPEFESLWNEACSGRFGVYRNQDYLDWRYGRFPDYGYLSLSWSGEGAGLKGFTIIGLKGKTAYLAELIPVDEEVTRILIGAAVRELRKMGIGKLTGYFLCRDDEREALKDAGFIERSSKLVFCLKFLGDEPPEGFYARDSWFASFGDTDGI